MFNLFDAAQTGGTAGGGNGMFFIMMALLFVVMYFFMIRPQKKQEREIANMRNNIIVGDEICTNGGIIGRVCSIKDDILTLEINKDRTKMKIYRWAVREVVNPMPRENEVTEAPKAEEVQKPEKKSKKAKKEDTPAEEK